MYVDYTKCTGLLKYTETGLVGKMRSYLMLKHVVHMVTTAL